MTGIKVEPVISANLNRHSNFEPVLTYRHELFPGTDFRSEKVLNSFILGEKFKPSFNSILFLRMNINGHFENVSRYFYY